MINQTLTNRRDEAGFTLVELAIVMIIIGLLIGGILKGQELVANAQVTATIAQIKGLDGAISTFRDKYSAMPGDIRNAGARLRNCTGNCIGTGTTIGNGRIDQPALGTVPAAAHEAVRTFRHLAAADLISGVDIDGTLNFGSALPEAKMGGGFWVGYTPNGVMRGVVAGENARAGHYLVFNNLIDNTGGTNGVTASQGGQVDRKIDDGDPIGGTVRATGTSCRASGEYNESVENSSCSLYIRVQG